MRSNKLFSILLFLTAFLLGCSQQGTHGVYFNIGEGSYIEIKRDGSFYAKRIRFTNGSFEADSRGQQVVGKYQWEEGGITFIFEGGHAVRGQARGDILSVGTSSDQQWTYWRGGKSGIAFEQKLSELVAKKRELSDQQWLDLLVKEGLLSPEGAQLERERRVASNRDAIVNDLNNIAASAYRYRILPKPMGGGGGSYVGFVIPSGLASNENATYEASIKSESITLTATSSYGFGTITATLDQNGRLSGWAYSGKFE